MAANAPVFFLHPRESYFPCTVEWFLQRAQLCVMRSVMLSRRVQRGAAQGCHQQPPYRLRMAAYRAHAAGRELGVRRRAIAFWTAQTGLEVSMWCVLGMFWHRTRSPSGRCSCAVLLDCGKMDAESLLAKSEAAASERLQLRLRSGARRGEPEIMNQVLRPSPSHHAHLYVKI